MPIKMNMILPAGLGYSLSQNTMCVLFIAASVLVSQLLLSAFNAWVRWQKLEFHNEVANTVFGTIGLMYSLILAFVIVAVWDDYKELNKTINAEADKLNNIIVNIVSLPDSIKNDVSKSILIYCNEVITEEWQMKKENFFSQSKTIPLLRQEILTIDSQDHIQQNVLSAINTDLSEIADLRRERIRHSYSQVPGMVWNILNVGSIMLITFFFFLQVPSQKLKRIYLGFLVTCMAMCMFLVYMLDHPFNSNGSISKLPYQTIESLLQHPPTT